MATYLVLLAVALAAEPAKDSAASPAVASRPAAADAMPGPRQLRNTIRDALRREATTTGAKHDDAVRRLVKVYNTLKEDEQLPQRERKQRLGQIRYRLAKVADRLERDGDEDTTERKVDGRTSQFAAKDADSPRASGILAQRAARPAAVGGAPAAPPAAAPQTSPGSAVTGEAAGAQQLIDLIQTTIAPETWDVRGGPGTIMYFPPKQVLVIRQTDDVHRQFRDVLQQLRQN